MNVIGCIFSMNSNDVSDLVIVIYNLQSLSADAYAGKIRAVKMESITIHCTQAHRSALDERSETNLKIFILSYV